MSVKKTPYLNNTHCRKIKKKETLYKYFKFLYLFITLSIYCTSYPQVYANFQMKVFIFKQQLRQETPFVLDFLDQVKTYYSATHEQFTKLGNANINASESIAKLLPKRSAMKNMYAHVVPSQKHGTNNIEVVIDFKSQEENEGVSAFFAGSSLVFTALGHYGAPISIPSSATNNFEGEIENEIISFSCRRKDATNGSFAKFKNEMQDIDLSPGLEFPFNYCLDEEVE